MGLGARSQATRSASCVFPLSTCAASGGERSHAFCGGRAARGCAEQPHGRAGEVRPFWGDEDTRPQGLPLEESPGEGVGVLGAGVHCPTPVRGAAESVAPAATQRVEGDRGSGGSPTRHTSSSPGRWRPRASPTTTSCSPREASSPRDAYQSWGRQPPRAARSTAFRPQSGSLDAQPRAPNSLPPVVKSPIWVAWLRSSSVAYPGRLRVVVPRHARN